MRIGRHIATCLLAVALMITGSLQLRADDVKTQQLGTIEGLSSNMVRCIFHDRQGYLWIGTINGLNRYDGFRFRTFFATNTRGAIPNSCVNEIAEDHDGKLWVKTTVGYAVYDPTTEQFDADIEQWMQSHGMRGNADRILPIANGDYWVKVGGYGCYFYDHTTGKARLFKQGKGPHDLPAGDINYIAALDDVVGIVCNNGSMACLNGHTGQFLYKGRTPGASDRLQTYKTFIDSQHNIWVWNDASQLFTFNLATRQWTTMTPQMMGLSDGMPEVKDMGEDSKGRLWIATDHSGLLLFDAGKHNTERVKSNSSGLTTTCVYIDKADGVWVGTYKNGVSYINNRPQLITTYNIGDITTIVDDGKGHYWCGSNDRGIVVFDVMKHTTVTIDMAQSGLGSNVVVSSMRYHDGALWFGTYRGGMACCKSGQWKVYRKERGGLADDNIWALAELPSGEIAIGTLGAGVQILNPSTGSFRTINCKNSALSSEYISSLSVDADGNLLIGHSFYFDKLDLKSNKITNYGKLINGLNYGVSPSTYQVLSDRRGLVWLCNESNVLVFNGDHIVPLAGTGNLQKSMPCGMAIDHKGNMWISRSNSLELVRTEKDGENMNFISTFYGLADGLPPSSMNIKSIICADNGNMVVGTQDGISIIPPLSNRNNDIPQRLIFSGLRIFGQEITAGQEVGDRIILKEALDKQRAITLENNQNTFSILLSTNVESVPNRTHFLYRLKGKGSQWIAVPENDPAITFNDLAPGYYELQVRVMLPTGEVQDADNSLTIFIRRPFYLSPWAFLVYGVLIVAIVFLLWRWHKQRRRDFIARMKEEEHRRIDNAKQEFFTNINHELRTPLTLIMAPLPSIIKNTDDKPTRDKLQLISRNAQKMQMLVNQMLDFRSIVNKAVTLHESNVDVVSLTESLCRQFKELNQREIKLDFISNVGSLVVNIDGDKLEKIVGNLLSNAMKFAPDNGHVIVEMNYDDGKQEMMIAVDDDGPGLSDADKQRVFRRFYQADNQKPGTSGSGIGLNIVSEYVQAMGGKVVAADSDLGGAKFTVLLPVVKTETDEADVVTNDAGDKPVVMIVDDSEDFLWFLASELQDEFSIIKAHNGREALEMINSGSNRAPDVVITDVMMPEMDGNELCRRIKSSEETRNIPVIMLSARMSDEHKIESMESGADVYFTKPFNLDILRLQVRSMAAHHHSVADNADKKIKIEPQVQHAEYTSIDEDFVRKATRIVEDNLDNEELTVERLSDDMALSRVHLYRRLVSLTGKTPTEFIRYIRLRHAAELLEHTQLTVSEIGYRVGISSQRYFSRVFKMEYGMLPTEYRQARKQGK